ncbi:MAG: hypothetical protein ATN31_11045 [Candidatus Epulonipiscioides saccharophilum]|nr:hypothetical protein AN643_02895 [Epulopiscium sp. SCG-B10WGA-EpuloB]OON95419.1 MAG: hypothetical protein ATN31_11045 [Epulopiscium sp. AS2M-Bin001]
MIKINLQFFKITLVSIILLFVGMSIFGFNIFFDEDTTNHINLILLGLLNFRIAKGCFKHSQFIVGSLNVLFGVLAFITAFFAIVF